MDVGYDAIIYTPKRDRIYMPGTPWRETWDVLEKEFPGFYDNTCCSYDSRRMTKEEVLYAVEKIYQNNDRYSYCADEIAVFKEKLKELPESDNYLMASFSK